MANWKSDFMRKYLKLKDFGQKLNKDFARISQLTNS